jgi:sugar lactone lactonase YvrE
MKAPANLVVDANGVAYIADRTANRILKRTPSGVLTVLAGDAASGQAGYVDAQGVAARFSSPRTVALSSDQTVLYVADKGNRRVRRIGLADGTVSTYAGSGNAGSFGPGYDEAYSGSGTTALTADFFGPTALAVDPVGNVYVLDAGSDENGISTIGIRLIAVNGQVSTLGGGSADSTPADSNNPLVMQFGQAGANTLGLALNASTTTLYVADDDRVRRINLANGTSSTLTGAAPRLQWTSLAYAQTSQNTAELTSPQGVAVDTLGNLFVADNQRVSVMAVASDGTLSTFVAGDLSQAHGTIAFSSDIGLSQDASNNLYLFYNLAPIHVMRIAPNATETPMF